MRGLASAAPLRGPGRSRFALMSEPTHDGRAATALSASDPGPMRLRPRCLVPVGADDRLFRGCAN